jgi:hypothetical protein
MLGIRPMNQLDLAAVPMWDLFTNTPDPSPYTAIPNQVPLDVLGPSPSASTGMARQWAAWSAQQDFHHPDRVHPAQLNRAIWYASTGWVRPYPGDTGILGPDEVPGRFRPAQDLDG